MQLLCYQLGISLLLLIASVQSGNNGHDDEDHDNDIDDGHDNDDDDGHDNDIDDGHDNDDDDGHNIDNDDGHDNHIDDGHDNDNDDGHDNDIDDGHDNDNDDGYHNDNDDNHDNDIDDGHDNHNGDDHDYNNDYGHHNGNDEEVDHGGRDDEGMSWPIVVIICVAVSQLPAVALYFLIRLRKRKCVKPHEVDVSKKSVRCDDGSTLARKLADFNLMPVAFNSELPLADIPPPSYDEVSRLQVNNAEQPAIKAIQLDKVAASDMDC